MKWLEYIANVRAVAGKRLVNPTLLLDEVERLRQTLSAIASTEMTPRPGEHTAETMRRMIAWMRAYAKDNLDADVPREP